MLATLESRRAEFTKNRAALQAVRRPASSTRCSTATTRRGQVLGAHGRGATDADVKQFADALAENLMQRYGSSLLDFNTRLPCG